MWLVGPVNKSASRAEGCGVDSQQFQPAPAYENLHPRQERETRDLSTVRHVS